METISFEEAIQNFLEDYANDDPAFAEKFRNPKKSISECCAYICQEVEKSRKNNERCVACSDEEVWGMAIHYYDEDDIVVKNKMPSIEKVETTIKKDEEKPKRKKKAKAEKNDKADPNIPDPVIFPIF